MEVGSRAGYYTSKSPKMILHEWCNRANRPKPRYKAIITEDGRFRCKVSDLFPRCRPPCRNADPAQHPAAGFPCRLFVPVGQPILA